MKVIDVLNKIANGYIPKKVVYEDEVNVYDKQNKEFKSNNANGLFNRWKVDKILNDYCYILDDEVEILDEPNKIEKDEPNKIEKLSWQQVGYKKYLGNGLETTRDIKEIVMDFNKQLDKSNNKLNEVIDKVNSLDKEDNNVENRICK